MSDDLNIENYKLEEILNLFNLPYDFNDSDLKAAYRIALKTHPDKSGLDNEYFRFYMKAYKIVEKIFYFRKKKKKSNYDTVYNSNEENISKDKAVLLHALNGKSVNEFNSWFNEMFEKVKVHDGETDNGYDNWIKNNNIEETNEKVSLSEFGQIFEKKKTECKALVKHNDISEISTNNGGYNLSREKITNYSSDIFSKLHYEDYKKAHTETVVPVTRQDFINKEKFNSVDAYKRHRSSQNTAAPSLQQSQRYLAERNKNNTELDSRRAFNILKRDEEIEKSNKKWWANLQRLKQ